MTPTPTPVQLAELLCKSTKFVTNTDGFLIFISLIITTGMFVGVRLNEGKIGFSRSLFVLFPYIILVSLVNGSRIYQTSLVTSVGSQAYNGLVTLILTSLAYILGLFVGHVIFNKAKRR